MGFRTTLHDTSGDSFMGKRPVNPAQANAAASVYEIFSSLEIAQ